MNVEKWLDGNQLGIDIWERKYRYNNETFDEWLDRVSGGNAKLRNLILEKKFLFGGRTLSNRCTDKKGSYSNCYSRGYVLDDLNDLMQAATDIALTFKAQGGQGISLSKIRPRGCGINNGQFESDGIIPFMEIYNRTTESISQGGSRKGALIMSLDIWHKEAEDFITIKSTKGKIEKANLSLEIDDEFMSYISHYYETGEELTKEIHRVYNGNEVVYEVTPIHLYKLMMERAYDWAEPGCIFTNRFRNYNMMQFHDEYEIETCNPCGEQPLPKHSACNLGSINLAAFVNEPFEHYGDFDFEEFVNAVEIAIEALDEVLDENMKNHPLPEQREMAYNYRNVGLGIMGLHDCLIKMGMTYGDEYSKDFISKLMEIMFRTAVIKSSKLAKEKGKFPKYNDSVLESEIILNHFDDYEIEEIRKYGLRNCSLLSIAPSGSIGTMLNISTGCEPNFRFSYKRKTESLKGRDEYYDVYAGVAEEYVNKFNTNELPDYFVTSSDINWRDRIEIQAILQNSVDTAISSTVNLPYETTLDEVEHLYLYAWQQGLKGVTIFRDGCKKAGILTTDESNKEENNNTNIEAKATKLKRGDIICVSDDLLSMKRTVINGCGKFYVHVDFDEFTGEPLETFIEIGSGGGCERNLQFISRLMSLCLRAGVPVDEIIDQSKSIRPCNAYVNRTKTKGDTSKGTSCPSAIGYALKELQEKINARCFADDEIEEYDEYAECESCTTCTENKIQTKRYKTPQCPECGEPLVFTGGCVSCTACSYQKCE